jgi:hypothetical protein
MKLTHLFLVAFLIILIYNFYSPRIIEGRGGRHGGRHGGGRRGGGGRHYGRGWWRSGSSGSSGSSGYDYPWYYPGFLLSYTDV